MFIFFLLSLSALMQVLLFMLPFARPFMALLLKEYLQVPVFAPLPLNRCSPLCFVFVFLNCNCSLSTAHSVYLHFLELKVSFYLLRGSNSFPALDRTFLLSFERRVAIPMKDNQVTHSEVEVCRIQQRNVLEFYFTVCEKIRR